MIILDTSIWIEYFKRNPDYKTVIDNLLREEKILAFDFVFGELLQGAKEHEKEKILGIWEILPKVDIREIGIYAGLYSQEKKLRDKGVGLIDCSIIYATIELKSKLWTLDKKILNVLDDNHLYYFHQA
jgi:predicted nucleic acid-binding protein